MRERADDGLEDDVATISYEQALRTHARRRPAAALGLPFEPFAAMAEEPETAASVSPEIGYAAEPSAGKQPATESVSGWAPGIGDAAARNNPVLAASRKAASITIRLTKAECEQVHERATAAGLTASAYLRSCLFEAENLRAQVKEALEQFRAAAPDEPAAAGKKPVRSEDHAADAARPGLRSWLPARWLGAKGA